jgi:hypothetical protein
VIHNVKAETKRKINQTTPTTINKTMKISTLITTALVALGIASQASADTVIYLTGSTAFRSTVEASLANNNGGGTNGGVFDAGTVTFITYGNAAAGSANYMVFHGTISNTPLYINCAWSGSEAGIASACNATLTNTDRNGNPIPLNGSPEAWLNVSNVTCTFPGTVIATNPATSLFENNKVPYRGADLAQADTSQAVSWTPYVAGTQTALKDYGVEGIVTFSWAKNLQTVASNEYLDCTNITIPQACTLLAAGAEPASYFSGNPADGDFTVYCVGRNLGSGTRMNELGDSTYGPHRTVHQYSIGYGIEEAAVNTLVLTNEGNNGYESGGGVGAAMKITGSCQQADPYFGGTGWFAIGFAGPSDWNNAGVPVSDWLTVSGVLESNGAIENGSFWVWGHEHIFGKYQISGIQDTVGNAIFNGVSQNIANQALGSVAANHDAAIANNYMNVVKDSDVGFPHP